MRRFDIYLPIDALYEGMVVHAKLDRGYSPKESAERLLDFLEELPHEVIREMLKHPRFELTKKLAKPLNERELEISLNR